MNFLPEDDEEYLRSKNIKYELREEKDQRGIIIPAFGFKANLRAQVDNKLVPCEECRLLVLVPSGYTTTRLDSFYTRPFLKSANGNDPVNANGRTPLFGEEWQFWSRHLTEEQWRDSIRGLEVYFSYIHEALRAA